MAISDIMGLDVSTVWLVLAAVLITAAVFPLYRLMLRHLAKTTVRNKVVLITDSLSALGNEFAKLFHSGGARLILCGNSLERLETLAEQLTDESDPTTTFPPKLVELDFSDMESVPEVISEILECYGCLDILIFNSSMKVKAPVQCLSLEMDRTVMDVNYFGPITLAKGVLPSLISRRTGHILLVNSIQGKLTVPFRATYAASKHAVQAFFDCLRAEVQQYGIIVSTVNHTFINTPTTEDEAKSTGTTFTKQKSLGVNPEEMASELLNTLSSKKKEILMARFISKAAIYTRSLFPNLFFAIMAAGVKTTTAEEMSED
ncbi:dehydrogenase/reductase SDR family member 7C-B [Triplophysa rosa]|uniref:Dehydrogenase/reductase SDR family member 7C-B n=1 Tax=Triplophysa rosa TaxID=992332 RepID=A0A9W7TUN7_TRIRA|nr:dehydrogenase/reductase SDR family member 7C-B [Triplophysa rosa]KAI7803324.1 dehydrogenase/reductase SDR family member 7C-B precursor [Triplophysa rosa]